MNSLRYLLSVLVFVCVSALMFSSCEDDEMPAGTDTATMTDSDTATDDPTTDDTDTDVTSPTDDGSPGGDTDTDIDTDTDTATGDGGGLSCLDGGLTGNVGQEGICHSDVGVDIPIQLTNSWSFDILDSDGVIGAYETANDDELFVDNGECDMQFIRYFDTWIHVDFKNYYEAIDLGGGNFGIVQVYREGMVTNQSFDIDVSAGGRSITGTGVQKSTSPLFAIDGELASRFDITIDIDGMSYRNEIWWIQEGVGIVQRQIVGEMTQSQIVDYTLTSDPPTIDAGVTASDVESFVSFKPGNFWTYNVTTATGVEEVTFSVESPQVIGNREYYDFFGRKTFAIQGEHIEVFEDINGDCNFRTLIDTNQEANEEFDTEEVQLASGENVFLNVRHRFASTDVTIDDVEYDCSRHDIKTFVNQEQVNWEKFWVFEGIGIVKYESSDPDLTYEISDYQVD